MSRRIASFAGWSTIVTGWSLLLAFLVSVVVGLVSGVYPAMNTRKLQKKGSVPFSRASSFRDGLLVIQL
jgi:hypothetical protein